MYISELWLLNLWKFEEVTYTRQELGEHRGLPEFDTNNNYDLVKSLLSPSPVGEAEDDDGDESLREALLLLFRLLWAQTGSNMESIETELEILREILRNTPPEEPNHNQPHAETQDTSWKLDAPTTSLSSRQGPILDANGKVRRHA